MHENNDLHAMGAAHRRSECVTLCRRQSAGAAFQTPGKHTKIAGPSMAQRPQGRLSTN